MCRATTRLAATAPAGVDPLGASLEVSLWRGRDRGFESARVRVVGITAHARHSDLTRELRPQLYAALSQSGRNAARAAVLDPTEALREDQPRRPQGAGPPRIC